MAPPKKKQSFDIYVDRYREIELYLNLLTRPLLTQFFPVTPANTGSIFEKVESEIKAFLEQKLQHLTGMDQDGSNLNLDAAELKALKLVASKIMNKSEPNITPEEQSGVQAEPVEWKSPARDYQITATNATVKAQAVEAVEVKQPVTAESDDEVKLVDVNTKRRRKAKTTKELIDETVLSTEVPDVKMGSSDRMDKVRPAGIKPLPSVTPQQAMHLAAMQAQMTAQAASDMGMGLGAPPAQQMNNSPIQLSDDFSMFR